MKSKSSLFRHTKESCQWENKKGFKSTFSAMKWATLVSNNKSCMRGVDNVICSMNLDLCSESSVNKLTSKTCNAWLCPSSESCINLRSLWTSEYEWLKTQKLPGCRNTSSTNRLFTVGIQKSNQSKQIHKSNKQYINLIYVKYDKTDSKILNFHVTYKTEV